VYAKLKFKHVVYETLADDNTTTPNPKVLQGHSNVTKKVSQSRRDIIDSQGPEVEHTV